MPIIERTAKLVLATVLATYVAEWLGLDYATSAGIIAILSVLDTRRSSLTIARDRLFSTLLALGIACMVFQIVGFQIWSLALYLVLYVPLAYRFKWEVGIAPSTVLVTHLLLEQAISWEGVGQEVALFLIGAGAALIMNSYMLSKTTQIAHYHKEVTLLLQAILHRFETMLLEGDGRNEATLIIQLDRLLDQALKTVYLDRHNQVFHQTNYQVHYFEMRAAQSKILRQMAGDLNHLHLESREGIILASLFERAAQQLSRDNSGQELLEDIVLFHQMFRERPLPQTREEFEIRAHLFQLLNDMERFIQLKADFYQTYYQD